MLIIVQIASSAARAELARKQRDSLILTSEQRRWVRGRFTTTAGREIALALPTGTTLEPGMIAWVGPDWYLAIEAARESVLAILPADSREAVRIAFEVGNRHFPLAMDGDALLVPDDTAMVQLLDRIGVKWERRQAVFQPIGKAHSHDHPHPNTIGADHSLRLAQDHTDDHSHERLHGH
ncbi:MAG: urease accessory protein UreE [Candidatus Acidiferrales bacterium]